MPVEDVTPVTDASVEDETSTTSKTIGEPLIVLTDVQKHFGELHVLRDINLTVAQG